MPTCSSYLLRTFLSLSLLSPFGHGKFIDNVNLLSREYDFVVVGGGTAGNVLANRLTENPDVSVLVLEAGGSNEGVLNAIVPFFCGSVVPNTPYDWNFTTVPQLGLNGRSVGYPRGHILGGTSSVNFMAYLRGSSSDWNRYAKITGDDGWSWDKLKLYFAKNEQWTAPADGHNTVGQYDPTIHSTRGVNSVSLAGFPHPIDGRIIQTTKELNDEFPFNLDMNSGDHLGVGWIQATIKGGRRSSSATSYLAPEFIDRPNLHVMLNARVVRLRALDDRQPLSFRTVEFVAGSDRSTRIQVTTSKEVILSAGAVMTPHVLMHSGIGDSGLLRKLGIPAVHNLPDVGRNLSDHPLLPNVWLANSTDTFETVRRNASLAEAQLREWNETQQGPLVDTLLDHLAWLRLPHDSPILQRFGDPASGANTAHYELLFLNGLIPGPVPATGNFLTIVTAVVSPTSRGSITLASADPFAAPNIDPGLLNSGFDLSTMREAVRSAERFLSAPTWQDYILGPFGDLANATTSDATLDAYIRNNAATIFHPVGTAAMSPKGAQWGVVEPDLRVKGVEGLRVVDASVLPIVPAAHTQAPVYVVAERASDLIKAFWRL